MAGPQAKRCYQAVNRLADRMTMLAQRTVVLGRRDCEIGPSGLEYPKFQETVLDLSKSRGIGDALQNFAEDEIGQAQSFDSAIPGRASSFRDSCRLAGSQ